MNEGIQAWNSKSDCAYVYFKNGTEKATPTGTPPPDTLWVTRGVNTQGFSRVDANNQMIAFDIRIWTAEPTTITPNWLRGLLSHETGHTFGLINSESNNTIMGEYTVVTECDTEAVKRVYCPTTPTPAENCITASYGSCSTGYFSNGCG
jgi:hypothetical protein